MPYFPRDMRALLGALLGLALTLPQAAWFCSAGKPCAYDCSHGMREPVRQAVHSCCHTASAGHARDCSVGAGMFCRLRLLSLRATPAVAAGPVHTLASVVLPSATSLLLVRVAQPRPELAAHGPPTPSAGPPPPSRAPPVVA